MVKTRRERQRDATRDEIKSVARQQMASQGAGALSLRAIAAAMGITAPAIYRYFPSRDDLITALIVDANNDLAETLEAASRSRPVADLCERFIASAHAYRAWALAHPAAYSLVLGTPIPGYHAPFAVTMPSARRALAVFLDLLMAVEPHGEAAGISPVGPDGEIMVPPAILHMALSGWARLHGLVTLELFGHLPALIDDPAALYHDEVLALAARAGLCRASPPDMSLSG